MVQEKDADLKRVQKRNDFLKKTMEDYAKSVVKTVWAVVEQTPPYTEFGYYGRDIPEKNVVVSKWFETEQEAREWRGRHVPDKGNTLLIAHKDLRRRVIEDWSPLFIERISCE